MAGKRFGVIVVGAGQSGLATGYHLARGGVDFVILDGAERVGESWRRRWDSLRLFTPARYDGLPGMAFPAPPTYFPTKDEMAAYLEEYARQFALPVRLGAEVTRISRHAEGYEVECDGQTLIGEQIVLANGGWRSPVIPAFADELGPEVRQLHAAGYRNPDSLQAGSVLVVGAGNSGAEIAMEAAACGHEVWLAGRPVGQVPPVFYIFGGRLFMFFANHVASRRNPVGRRILARAESHGGPLINLRLEDVTAAGVEPVGRVAGIEEGSPRLADGRVLEAANVVWCTGFQPDFTCLAPGLRSAAAAHREGRVEGEPGLHLIGMPFQTKLASAFVGGVGADAEALVGRMKELRGRVGLHGRATSPV
jgi:putative flavoprotein involved in K+ transport